MSEKPLTKEQICQAVGQYTGAVVHPQEPFPMEAAITLADLLCNLNARLRVLELAEGEDPT